MAQLESSITTDRLTLRRFAPGDLRALSVLYGDESVTRYLYFGTRDHVQTQLALEKKLAQPVGITDDNVLPVAAVLTSNGRLVGDFMLRWTANEHRQGEIGGSLAPEFHGMGYAPEIYRELLSLGFNTFGLHRIVGRCDGRNAASIRSLEKAGLHREAHFLENEFVKGEWTDEVVLALRRSEWLIGQTAR